MPSRRPSMSPYALRAERSRGRRHHEPEHPYRDAYERDRDRIVHSRAFRRLEYKTQVFPNHHGDHFRTRLTHTIEVAQLARTVARVLGVNETVAEAIALAHDIGHPPFGHIGESALDEGMAEVGGFEHNRHALRTVDEVEERYAAFRGLNLTFEVREGLAKHSSRYERYADDELDEFLPDLRPPIEAQIIDFVDHIAYNVHDIDDGAEAHVIEVEHLVAEVPLVARAFDEAARDRADMEPRAHFNEALRRLTDSLMTDLVERSRRAIEESGVASVRDVREHPKLLIGHSPDVLAGLESLQSYLSAQLYRSDLVDDAMERGRRTIAELFRAFVDDPELLPERHQRRARRVGLMLAVGDYVAGMTDRFVTSEHERLLGEGFSVASEG